MTLVIHTAVDYQRRGCAPDVPHSRGGRLPPDHTICRSAEFASGKQGKLARAALSKPPDRREVASTSLEMPLRDRASCSPRLTAAHNRQAIVTTARA